jgi:phospholipid-binding lipoprotein MlaA
MMTARRDNPVKMPSPLCRMLVVAVAACALGACATTSPRGAPSPDDPFEPMNRVAYEVHQVVDGQFIRPMVQAYVDYAPKPIQQVIRNFFGNIDDLFSFVNDVLQGKPDKAGHDLGRVITNTAFGIGGIIDVAGSAVPKGEEDFGQTFGAWGISQGPYLFIPVFGPTTVRDGIGWVIRGYASPISHINDIPVRNSLWGLSLLDLRASALQAESLIDQAAIDRYTFIRRAYLQRRRYLVYDGQPPPAKEEDE